MLSTMAGKDLLQSNADDCIHGCYQLDAAEGLEPPSYRFKGESNDHYAIRQ